MSNVAWFVYPVENGVELVIDGTSNEIYEAALAAFVAEYQDMNLASEWSTDGGDVLFFVPAPVDAVPAPRPGSADQGRSRSADEERARAAHPAGKGRKMPEQRWEI
jgi:hypothetical protein